MWQREYRDAADRSGLRDSSDLTGAECTIVEPITPAQRCTPIGADPA